MERRPWPIVILALLNLLAPLFYLLKTYYTTHFPLVIFVKALFLPENILLTIHMIIPCLVAAVSIYAVKKWSYHVFFLTMMWVIIRNFYNYFIANDISALQLIGAILVNILLVSYFLIPAIKEAYMNPKLRWWEAKTRYKKSIHVLLQQDNQQYHGTISNISEGGVFINSCNLAIDNPLRLAFTDNQFHFNLEGKVVYQIPDGNGYGIQFFNLNRTLKKELKKFVLGLEKQKVPLTRPLKHWTIDLKEWIFKLASLKGQALIKFLN